MFCIIGPLAQQDWLSSERPGTLYLKIRFRVNIRMAVLTMNEPFALRPPLAGWGKLQNPGCESARGNRDMLRVGCLTL